MWRKGLFGAALAWVNRGVNRVFMFFIISELYFKRKEKRHLLMVSFLRGRAIKWSASSRGGTLHRRDDPQLGRRQGDAF